MKRRAFFAVLLAPLIARFAPKPLAKSSSATFGVGDVWTPAGVYRASPISAASEYQAAFNRFQSNRLDTMKFYPPFKFHFDEFVPCELVTTPPPRMP